ncbi:MAG: transcription factor E [Candidatus Odinarchaeia archaeon]
MNTNIKRKIFTNVLEEIKGDINFEIVDKLSEDEEITDEELAEKTGLKLNIVRKVLYRLYDNHLATYRRIRDKNTGWFIYYWKLNLDKIYDLTKKRKELVLKRLEERLNFEKEHQFYYCPKDESIRLTFEEAMEASFKCPHCGELLQFKDNSNLIKVLEAKIDELKKLT